MTAKKQRLDTVAGAVATMADALAGSIEPPAHIRLRSGDRPFWDSIILARARHLWDDADLELAGNLARCKADVERLQTEIDSEGDIISNERGTPIVNPKHSLLETLSRRSVALSRMIHVHAEAKHGQSREQAKKLGAQKTAAQVMADSDDGLIARPTH